MDEAFLSSLFGRKRVCLRERRSWAAAAGANKHRLDDPVRLRGRGSLILSP